MAERIGEAILEIETDIKPLIKGLEEAEARTNLWARTMEGVMRAHGVRFGESLAKGIVSASSMQQIEKALGNVQRATEGVEKAETRLSNKQEIGLQARKRGREAEEASEEKQLQGHL